MLTERDVNVNWENRTLVRWLEQKTGYLKKIDAVVECGWATSGAKDFLLPSADWFAEVLFWIFDVVKKNNSHVFAFLDLRGS